MRPATRVALALIMCVAAVAAAGEDIQHSLNDKYKGQILALRHPLEAANQQYDFTGKILSSDAEGPWTVFGRIRIQEIHVESKRLRIKAARLHYQVDRQAQNLVPVPAKDHVTLDIALSNPLSSEPEADSILSSVFALNDQDVLNTAPLVWRDYLKKHLAPVSSNAQAQQSSSAKETTAVQQEDSKVLRTGDKAVSFPKALYTPEPEFTDFARKANYQGVLVLSIVVGTDGLVHRVSIVRPLGMGLDENAVAKVSTWRFQPGTKNGEPVAIAMQVEVSFNLYQRK